ncbi:MAG: Tm-1-like ATP-binding domain-containing protein [Dinoroseobacter sp.]|nr:Tm-1-like ATP-binding domain-containing protein [Dinoroseobacter sp.]
MTQAEVLVLATLDTKREETAYLVDRISEHGVAAQIIDISLTSNGGALDETKKLEAIDRIVTSQLGTIVSRLDSGINAVVGMGGGTGGEIALRLMRALPITFPKVLVTTLPFDPRIAAADSSIVFVPTLVDICGLNATLREVMENTAALTAGLCSTRRQANACVAAPSIAVTGLGATEGAVKRLTGTLKEREIESTVFHANGYGGAAFARFAERGAFSSVIDLTPHEVTRIHVAGAHVPMPTRFSSARDIPYIMLPGGINFIGLGERSLVPSEYLDRPHYAHSGYFTHVKLTPIEICKVAEVLADSLNSVTGPAALIVPMGGFSHQDCPGGAIEDAQLRQVFLDQVSERLSDTVKVEVLEAHICAPQTTQQILETLDAFGAM